MKAIISYFYLKQIYVKRATFEKRHSFLNSKDIYKQYLAALLQYFLKMHQEILFEKQACFLSLENLQD